MDETSSHHGGWWPIFQALGWIGYRDLALAAEIGACPASAFDRLFGPRASYAAMQLTLRQREGVVDSDPWKALRPVLVTGDVTAKGRYLGAGLRANIPADEWDVLDLVDCIFLNDRTTGDYVASPWTYGAGAPTNWWAEPRINAAELQTRFPAPKVPEAVAPRMSEDAFRDRIIQIREGFGAISGEEAYGFARGFEGVTRETARKINLEIGGNTKSGPISRTAETRRLIRDEIARLVAPENSRAARDGALAGA